MGFLKSVMSVVASKTSENPLHRYYPIIGHAHIKIYLASILILRIFFNNFK